MSNFRIPKNIPVSPGVYFMKDARGKVLYVGKAQSLKSRVGSYFNGPHDRRIEEMISRVVKIDWRITPTALEALLLEARMIKKFKSPYNILGRDDKSFLFVVFLKEDYPKPILMRLPEVRQRRKQKKVLAEFGPFLSAATLRASLDLLRKVIPWSECKPNQKRPCFYYQLSKCPGVCAGLMKEQEYRKHIRQLILIFRGRSREILSRLINQMNKAAKKRDFEQAVIFRDHINALRHINNAAFIKRDFYEDTVKEAGEINMTGRLEAYDISNIGGKYAVGSMIVFNHGESQKFQYRRFKIKTVKGANDPAMIREILFRRFAHVPAGEKIAWAMPEMILIDGGIAQLHAVKQAMILRKVYVPVLALSKGISRKGITFLHEDDPELVRIVKEHQALLINMRDEAHRFAINYHRKLMRERL